MRVQPFSSVQYGSAPYIFVAIMLAVTPVLFAPFLNHSFTQGKGLFFTLMMLVIGVWYVYALAKSPMQVNQIKYTRFLFALLAMYAIFTVTNAFGEHPGIAFFGSISRGIGFNVQLLAVALSLVIAFHLKSKYVESLLKLALIPATLNALYALLQKGGYELFFQDYGLDIFEGRAFGFYGNPSYLGQALSLFLIVALFFLFTQKKRSHIIVYGLIAAVLFSGIVVSGTRTSLLGLFAAGILMLLRFVFHKIHVSGKQVTVAIVVCAALLFMVTTIAPSRFSFSPLAVRSLNSRIEIWKGTVELIKRKPFIGYGTNTFQIYFPDVISKDFYALEENLDLNVDRVHNETLETFFQYGMLGGVMYLVFLGTVLIAFFRSRNSLMTVLTLLILTYHVQNQVSFPDISIMMFVFVCYGGVCTIGAKRKTYKSGNRFVKRGSIFFVVLILSFFAYTTFYKPLRAELAYSVSKTNREYNVSVLKLKEAIGHMPYYTELWYELMMVDPSSRERGLHYLRQLEGDTGNVNAWMGNLYAKTDPNLATKYYLKALERNPYNPNWIRAFADMLFYHEDYENALLLYSKYLEAIPEIWYVDEDHQNDEVAKKKARIFLKNTPYLNEVFEKIEFIESVVR